MDIHVQWRNLTKVEGRGGDIETDLLALLVAHHNKAKQVIVYCRSLNTVADLFSHFQYTLGNDSYHPPGA